MLIGLHGQKQVGKDTIADYLVEEYKFVKIPFARKLKEAVANLFDISVVDVDNWKSDGEIPTVEVILDIEGGTQYSYSWREFLQRFGTEMGRETFGNDFWLDQWMAQYTAVQNRNVVVTDVRFQNEARLISRLKGYVVQVTRPGYLPDGHASEVPIAEDYLDAWISNAGTLDELYDDVDQLMEDINAGAITNLGVSARH